MLIATTDMLLQKVKQWARILIGKIEKLRQGEKQEIGVTNLLWARRLRVELA